MDALNFGIIILAVIAGAVAIMALVSYGPWAGKVRRDEDRPADPGEPRP